jgi:hypothetical protein
MTAFITADEYRERFAEAPIIATGSLADDILFFAQWCAGARDEVYQGNLGAEFLSETEPLDDALSAAASLSFIYARLRQDGFCPPALTPELDPMEFLEQNAEFLASVLPFVGDLQETIH